MKSTVELKGVYHNYEYLVVRHEAEIMEWYCGYVKLPRGHAYVPLTHKKSWTDLGFLMWKTKNKVGKKPKARRRYFHNGYDDMKIDVHGGLTFSDYFKKPSGHFSTGAWIGWDYNHAGDSTYKQSPAGMDVKTAQCWKAIVNIHSQYPTPEKRWTAPEVEVDCKNVIEQLEAR